MITQDSIKTVYNVKIEFTCINNYKSKLCFKNQQFIDMMNARYISDFCKIQELHQLIIATSLNALNDEVIAHQLSPIESFTITYKDEEGYNHIIER